MRQLNQTCYLKAVKAVTLAAVWIFLGAMSGCTNTKTTADCESQALTATAATVEVSYADGRSSQMTVWQPDKPGRYPLMVFSHGAFSAPQRYEALLSRFSGMGFVVVAPLHIDSELLDIEPPPAPAEVWRTRKQDIATALTVPESVAGSLAPGISLDQAKVAAGHSYGGFGAQVAVGAAATGDSGGVVLPGVEAVVAFSPPGMLPGFIEPGAWDQLARPQLLITGTGDVLPGFLDDWRDHTAGWELAPAGDQWLWVGEGVDHYFGRVFGRLERETPPQVEAFEAAMETTQQFLGSYVSSGLAVCTQTLTTSESPTASIKRR